METRYVRREFLNEASSPNTATVVGYYGLCEYDDDGDHEYAFLEVADCHRKIRLHYSWSRHDDAHLSKEAFVAKLRLLAEVCNEMADFIDTDEGWGKGNDHD